MNNKIVVRGKLNSMIGINKWKDLEQTEPELWDIAMLEISLSQNVLWNPLDKRSFIMGVGLFESVNYIYYKNVRFQPGILLHIGLKL